VAEPEPVLKGLHNAGTLGLVEVALDRTPERSFDSQRIGARQACGDKQRLLSLWGEAADAPAQQFRQGGRNWQRLTWPG
jgi:hypothetical protein